MPKIKHNPPRPADAGKLIKALAKLYPLHPLEVNNNPEPFKVLIATMLSARTKDPVTNEAMLRLWKRGRTPKGLLAVNESEIAELIKPVGFYKSKAGYVHGICRALTDSHGGKVPMSLDELVALPGVGRKVANLVLSVCFDIPAICVDTHVHRITNRLGWVETVTPEQTEFALMEYLPKRHWAELNRVLVNHGQQICHPVSPKCSECPIAKSCNRIGVTTSR